MIVTGQPIKSYSRAHSLKTVSPSPRTYQLSIAVHLGLEPFEIFSFTWECQLVWTLCRFCAENHIVEMSWVHLPGDV